MKMNHPANTIRGNEFPTVERLYASSQALHPRRVGEEQAAECRSTYFRQPTSFPTNDKAQTGPAFRVSPGRCLRQSQPFISLRSADRTNFNTNDKLPAGPAFRVSPGRSWQHLPTVLSFHSLLHPSTGTDKFHKDEPPKQINFIPIN